MNLGYLLLIISVCYAAFLLFAWSLCRISADSDNEFPPTNHGPVPPPQGGHSDAELSLSAVRRPWRSAGADVGSAPASLNTTEPRRTDPSQAGAAGLKEV